MNNTEKAELINLLGDFCGRRDIPDLTQKSLENVYGIKKADVFVLFGGSILAGGDVLAEAIKEQIAHTYIIVGGAGHTTDTLRRVVRQKFADMETENLSEAEIFNRYIRNVYGPQGKNFLSHVDIPEEVEQAFEKLKLAFADRVREANPLYASK
ncbi:MAG: hypothetical protein KH452_11650 [Clostridiales bacterium]|nr:hypothetical protein [Clostridiales bacterium]